MFIFRNDDVCASSNFTDIDISYAYLRSKYDCQIWTAVNVFNKFNQEGSSYGEEGVSYKEKSFYYGVNEIVDRKALRGEIVSHGLIHANHQTMTPDIQEMNIVVSCNVLGTKKFLPPFGLYNETTERICSEYNIQLIKSDGWHSLESEPWNPCFEKWFFHSWKTPFIQLRSYV